MEFRALSRAILLDRRRWNFGDQWKVGRREYPDHQQSRQHATVLHPPPQIMQKHTRGQERPILEGAYRAYDELLVKTPIQVGRAQGHIGGAGILRSQGG